MAGETTTVETNVAQSVETGNGSGEPKGSAPEPSQSTQKASGEGGTAGEVSFEGMDHIPAEHREKTYKSMQAEYTRLNEKFKTLEKYGGADQIVQWAEYLASNPRFAEWVQKEQGRNVLGVKEDELDETQLKALQVVRTLARQETEAAIKEIREKEIGPLSEKYKERLLDEHFSAMDKKYEGWRELQDVMADLSESLPKQAQDNPDLEDIEDLYFKALRKAGKFNSYAAKIYQKDLQQKQAKSTEKPSAAPASAPKQFKTIAEAFEYAKKQHGG